MFAELLWATSEQLGLGFGRATVGGEALRRDFGPVDGRFDLAGRLC